MRIYEELDAVYELSIGDKKMKLIFLLPSLMSKIIQQQNKYLKLTINKFVYHSKSCTHKTPLATNNTNMRPVKKYMRKQIEKRMPPKNTIMPSRETLLEAIISQRNRHTKKISGEHVR